MNEACIQIKIGLLNIINSIKMVLSSNLSLISIFRMIRMSLLVGVAHFISIFIIHPLL